MLQDRLRFASYNIRKSVGTDRRRDPGRILDVINDLEADVVALQEIDKRLGNRPTSIERRLIEEHTDFHIAQVARSSASLGWHGNAVLVRKSLKVRAVDHIVLPGLEPRGAVQVDIGDERCSLSVVGVHLGLLRSFRRAQLTRIIDHLKGVDSDSSIILGDFNEWSATEGLEPLAEEFEVISPGKSFHSARPLAALDRIALGRGLSLVDAGVARGAKASVASDHLPIWTDVQLTLPPK